jgi:hypothetical protein
LESILVVCIRTFVFLAVTSNARLQFSWQVASNVLYLCLSYALDYACVPDSLGGCCMDILPYEQFFFLTQQPAAELYSKLIFWHKTNTGPCANCFSLTKTHLNFQL